MKKIILSGALLSFVVLSGCYFDNKEELYPNLTSDCDKSLTYNTGIKTLIDNNCSTSGCHVPGGGAIDLSTYSLVKANSAKITDRAIVQKNMPAPSGMSSCNITKLDNWIKAGMPEN